MGGVNTMVGCVWGGVCDGGVGVWGLCVMGLCVGELVGQ